MKSSLAPFASLMNEADESLARKAAAKAWHEHGILLVNPSWFRGWARQQEAINLAELMYGKRTKEGTQ